MKRPSLDNPERQQFLNLVNDFFAKKPVDHTWLLLLVFLIKENLVKRLDFWKKPQLGDDVIAYRSNLSAISPFVVYSLIESRCKDKGIDYHYFASMLEFFNDSISKSSQEEKAADERYGYLFNYIDQFISLGNAFFSEYSVWAYEYIARKIQRVVGEELLLPTRVQELIVKSIGSIQPGSSLYHPDAGICALASKLEDDVLVYANESNPIAYKFGKIHNQLNKRSQVTHFSQDHSFSNMEMTEFDYVVGAPCISSEGEPVFRDSVFVKNSSRMARKKVVAIVSMDFCYSASGHDSIIHELISKNYLESVVLLPSKVFDITDNHTVLLVINKEGRSSDCVRMVDARECWDKEMNTRKNLINLESIVTLCNSSDISRKVGFVSSRKIAQNDFIIFPLYYLKEEIEHNSSFKEAKLSQYLEIFDPKSTPSNFGDNKLVIYQQLGYMAKTIPGTEFKDNLYSLENAFLYELKKHTSINLDYLLSQLGSSSFWEQISRFGVDGEFLSAERYLQLKILVPEKARDQEHIVIEDQKQQLDKAAKEYRDQRNLQLEDFIKDVRMRKHAVGQVLNEIIPGFFDLRDFINDHDSISKNDIVCEKDKSTVSDYLNSLEKELKKVTEMIKDFVKTGYIEGNPAVKKIHVRSFLNDYLAPIRVLHKNIVYDYKDEGDENIYILMSEPHLHQILDNILSNAYVHGFDDPSRQDYCIRIRVEATNDKMVSINVCNNGRPAYETVDTSQMFIWGYGTKGKGSGIGCTQMKNIAEHFNGEIQYHEYRDDIDGFKTEFSILLPQTI